MNEIVLSKTDELVMKLLHYFIIEQNYTPIILHGVQNEIWLENLGEEYKVVRIVSNYIHNDEQFTYDLFKTQHVMKKIKRKTLSLHMNTLSIFVNLGENVKSVEKANHFRAISCIELTKLEDLEKNELLKEKFPSIMKENNFKEKGAELFMKLTIDINKKSEQEAQKNETIFAKKTPIITYFLLIVHLIFFLLVHFNTDILEKMILVSKENLSMEYFRIFTNIFVHYNMWHFLFNSYVLYIIGSELESLIGKGKFITVYCISGIASSLFMMAFLGENSAVLGATGAIFGLLGSLLYFGYYYRVYLGTIVKSQIIPLILFSILFTLLFGETNFIGQIGGIVAGVFATMTLGIPYKTTTFERVNGGIVLFIYLCFLSFLALVGI